MTKKEALSIIESMRPGCGEKPIYTEGELCEAYDMATVIMAKGKSGTGQKKRPLPKPRKCARRKSPV